MSETTLSRPVTSVSTFGYHGAYEHQCRTGPFDMLATDLKEYGVHSTPPEPRARQKPPTTRPVCSGAYFVTVAQSQMIECCHFRADDACAGPDDSPETYPRGIHSSLRDVTAVLYFKAANACAAGEETRPLIPLEYGPVRQDQNAKTWIEQKNRDISKVIRTVHAAQRKSSARDHLALLELASDLGQLEDGWNSYSAPAPTAIAIENAKALLIAASTIGIIAERVEPSAMGGVGVTFTAGTREAVVEFYNAGTAHALFADNETEEMRTERVPTDPNGYGMLLKQVRQYLYGYAAPQSCGPRFS